MDVNHGCNVHDTITNNDPLTNISKNHGWEPKVQLSRLVTSSRPTSNTKKVLQQEITNAKLVARYTNCKRSRFRIRSWKFQKVTD